MIRDTLAVVRASVVAAMGFGLWAGMSGCVGAGGTIKQTAAPATMPAGEPPVSWVDKDTGHRVHRLTPEANSTEFYFNINAYTPDGKEMVYSAPDGIHVLELATFEDAAGGGGTGICGRLWWGRRRQRYFSAGGASSGEGRRANGRFIRRMWIRAR